AVVHHFRVVPGADFPGVDEPLIAWTFRTQSIEDRHGTLDLVYLSADHQAIPVLGTPHSAGDTGVDVLNTLRCQGGGMLGILGEPRVASIDDQVTSIQQPTKF